MKIVLISTSRADLSALQVVGRALAVAKHDVELIEKRPAISGHGLIYDHVGYALARLRPDIAFVHGDRWDALLAAMACVTGHVPLAHIGGGDITTGSYDDRFRDAISMLACLHFVGTAQAALRLSEFAKGKVYVVGEPAIDWLKHVQLATREQTFERHGITACDGFVLVNWQPETAAAEPNGGLSLILEALSSVVLPLYALTAVVFASPGADRGGVDAWRMIKAFAVEATGHRVILNSFSLEVYAALMKHCDVMVGNSSSGLIEAPTLGTRFIMVGDRQKGRLIPPNTIKIRSDESALLGSTVMTAIDIARSYSSPCYYSNPYGDGTAGKKIRKVMDEWRQQNQMAPRFRVRHVQEPGL